MSPCVLLTSTDRQSISCIETNPSRISVWTIGSGSSSLCQINLFRLTAESTARARPSFSRPAEWPDLAAGRMTSSIPRSTQIELAGFDFIPASSQTPTRVHRAPRRTMWPKPRPSPTYHTHCIINHAHLPYTTPTVA